MNTANIPPSLTEIVHMTEVLHRLNRMHRRPSIVPLPRDWIKTRKAQRLQRMKRALTVAERYLQTELRHHLKAFQN